MTYITAEQMLRVVKWGRRWMKGENRMLSGIILAGGITSGIRGGMKSLYPLEGETLIERQIRLMKQLCDEIIVVTNSPRSYLHCVPPQVRIVSDYKPGSGPLGGMAAGLSLAQQPFAWIVGCDMPYLSPDAAKWMMKRLLPGTDAVWASDLNGIYPLHGVYDCRCAPQLTSMVDAGKTSLRDLPYAVAWEEVTEGECRQMGFGFDFVTKLGRRLEAEPATM
ncbi:molybdenum cofactor guanylyltransferase [Cohnella lubricantis]|uniref:Molybdenum cofactor guanylyltransferase n=1 Tax=Cohnella lubricantis TaxID=2163172 RepID=A0A841TD89_9BACL|nr:molybdenum cofactor guanylyltransferase [Cohnella lubricantis]MBB6679002.1 molybdenum cofactor guanylyltransferase [Cohnella lubricantis]MBP2119510.1 molybdopterin-guanine dinucleotide biosynthesis protein A [Cohnella lubricantis]